MSDNLLTVQHNKEIDLGNGEISSNVYVRVYTSIFTSGIVAKIGATGFTTLMALATFMDENGQCYPTQDQLAERIGVHKNTANKYINDLLAVRINGKPIVTRTKVNKGQGKIYSYYTIHPLSQLAKFNGEIEEIENHKVKDTSGSDSLITPCSDSKSTTNCDEIIITNNNNHLNNNNTSKEGDKHLNSNSAIKLFQQVYREVYGVNYVVSNYGREGKLIKDKVLTPYPDLAREIIETAVREYDKRWKNQRYPRPTISMFSWVVNQVIEVIEEQRKLNEVIDNSEELAKQAEREMMEKLAKLG